MRLADYVIQRLHEAGIDHVFTVCGGGSIFLNDALRKSQDEGKVKYIACHHEQAAVMAAEGYARARNRIGCAIVTSGPGGTNAITGVAGCWTDSVPVLVISGQVFRSQMRDFTPHMRTPRTIGVQEINILDMVRPVTKYAACVMEPERMRVCLETALSAMTHDRPGPAWLDIPADVQNAQLDPATMNTFPISLEHYFEFPKRTEDEWTAAAQDVLALLKNAKRPVIHVGQGVRLAYAEEELATVVESMNIPVLTARNGNDLIASDHPCFIGRPGTFANRGANFAVQTCDLYIAIGTRLSLAQTGYNAKDYARNAKIVMVDIDQAELDKDTVRVDLKIRMDAQHFLQALDQAVLEESANGRIPDWSAWLARCKACQAKYPPVLPEMKTGGDYVNSYHLIDELSEQLTPNDIIVTDMGFAFQNTHQAFRVKQGQRLMTNGGLAAMGWGLPAAIGAAIGTGRRVVLIVGDGGLMMNLQELATLAHHELWLKIFLLNNGGYLTMRQSQAHAFDGYMGSDRQSGLSFPDFSKVAESFGIPHWICADGEALADTVAQVIESEGPTICEILMDPNQDTIPKSVNRREADGRIVQTPIEDAWPYLDRDELARELAI